MTDGELVTSEHQNSSSVQKQQVTSGANSIAQRATITAVDDPSVMSKWLTLSTAVEI
jgi:hypothetical protein